MAVYVDDMFAEFRGMLMCHLIADTHAELLAMVDRISVQRKWIQHAGTYREHFDIAKGKRVLALRAGALPISWEQYACMVDERQHTGQLGTPGGSIVRFKERRGLTILTGDEDR
jgi:hypothetical protein